MPDAELHRIINFPKAPSPLAAPPDLYGVRN